MNLPAQRVAWVVGLLLLALLAGRFLRSLDPIYRGRHLSDYLATTRGMSLNYGCEPGSGTGLPFRPAVRFGASEARAAVQAVGPNALPMLVNMLGSKARPTRWDAWIRRWAVRYPVLGRLAGPTVLETREQQLQALVAFHMLGPQGAAAIPRILPLLRDPATALAATLALGYLRPERPSDFMSLTNVLALRGPDPFGEPPEQLHATALLVLSNWGTNAALAQPILAEAIRSPAELVQAAAALALARVGAPPEFAVPLIVNSLPKPEPQAWPTQLNSASIQWMLRMPPSRDNALLMKVRALADYGPSASNALPVLARLGSFRDSDLNAAISAAIAKIRGAAPTQPPPVR